jgi:RNA polymerase sigma-70 factor (ECF subfamily)
MRWHSKELFAPGLRFIHWSQRECQGADGLHEADLVARCLAGDEGAWERIVQLHTRRIYNLCFRFTGRMDEAEDLTQDAFLRIFRNLKSYSPAQGVLGTWMISVTRNLLIDHYRRTHRERLTIPLEEELPRLEEKASATPPPDRRITRIVMGKFLQQALDRLSPDLREAVILRDVQELDYKEIQAILGVPEGTVKSRINRGRVELARLLKRSKQQLEGMAQ